MSGTYFRVGRRRQGGRHKPTPEVAGHHIKRVRDKDGKLAIKLDSIRFKSELGGPPSKRLRVEEDPLDAVPEEPPIEDTEHDEEEDWKSDDEPDEPVPEVSHDFVVAL